MLDALGGVTSHLVSLVDAVQGQSRPLRRGGAGMSAGIAALLMRARRVPHYLRTSLPSWSMLVLSLGGTALAGYLTFFAAPRDRQNRFETEIGAGELRGGTTAYFAKGASVHLSGRIWTLRFAAPPSLKVDKEKLLLVAGGGARS